MSGEGEGAEDRTGSVLETPVTVRIDGGRREYPVFVETGGLDRLPALLRERAPAHRYAVLSDTRVAKLYGRAVLDSLSREGLAAELHTFPEGEAHKTRAEWARLTDLVLEDGLGRDGAVVALGGGVTGDLAGFVAATYMRGIPLVQVPTSLVAMIDASVGGKTGVDVDAGKNLVGAFHPPRFVLADPGVVATLPRDERGRGLAEGVKHGAILDRLYLDALSADASRLLDGEADALLSAVRRSVEIKAGVVSRDEREAGVRRILNFGHTLGHALEAESAYHLPHGSAVATGMVLEARIGERLGVTDPGTSERLAEVIRRFELPVAPPEGADPDRVLERTGADKKRRGGRPRYVLLARLGEVAAGEGWTHPVPDEVVRSVLREASGP